MKIKFDRKAALAQLAINSIAGAVAGFGLAGFLLIAPEKDMKVDPLTSLSVTFMALSASGGAVVSITHLRKFLKDDPN